MDKGKSLTRKFNPKICILLLLLFDISNLFAQSKTSRQDESLGKIMAAVAFVIVLGIISWVKGANKKDKNNLPK